MSKIRKAGLRRTSFAVGHPLHGLELLTQPVRCADLDKIGTAAESDSPAAVRAKTLELFSLFADKIESWNYQLEDGDGNTVDVPPTLEGLLSIGDDDGVFLVLNEWLASPAAAPIDAGGPTSAEHR